MAGMTINMLANVGTPLMWASMFHLWIGNALIGIGEGMLLARLFRVRWWRAILCMCGANYFSMGVTVFGLARAGHDPVAYFAPDITIGNAGIILTAAAAVCLLGSAIVEWPFCYLSLAKAESRLKSSVLGTIVVQIASHAILIPLYLLVSPVGVLTKVSTVDARTVQTDFSADVFYVDLSRGDVYRTDLNGAARELVAQINLSEPHARLYLQRSSESETYDLLVRWGRKPDKARVVQASFLSADANIGDALAERHTSRDGWMSFGPAIDLQPKSNVEWSVRTGFWPGEGITATNEHSGRSLWLALETPFLSWESRCATVLPGGLTVYQLGDQIVLLDPGARKIALLARGRGPLVVLR